MGKTKETPLPSGELSKTPAEFALEKGILNEESSELAKIKLGECYENINAVIHRYMDMPEDYVRMVSIWIIGTYFHYNFSAYPFLFINAMRGSGKTRLLSLISHLSKGSQGEVQTGITESVLFRSGNGTLVMDECESLGTKEKAVLREFLNACYKKGGVVKRMKKAKFKGEDEFIAETFRPFRPIAMANIWGIEEVLGDRCITLILEKSNNPLKTKKIEDFDENKEMAQIKATLQGICAVNAMSLAKKTYKEAWNNFIETKYSPPNDITAYTYITTLTTLTTTNNINNKEEERKSIKEYQELEDFFNKIDAAGIEGRNFELLFPLLIISNFLNEEEFDKILKIGGEIMQIKKEDEFTESRDVLLYEFVSQQPSELSYVRLKEFTSKFKIFVGEDDWANEKWVGRALKRLNIVISKRREAAGRLVILNVAKAKEKAKIFGGGNGN